MSLKKLFDNGFLKKAKPTRKDIDDKFGVARRNLRDAAIKPVRPYVDAEGILLLTSPQADHVRIYKLCIDDIL